MAQQLSDDEFHRMQLQLIEMRTENYQLKDENKKQLFAIKDLSEKEAKLDKELKNMTKMKRALSVLNKTKQAQEFEDILRQTEQEFSLQNDTLKQELSRLSMVINRLEKENKNFKSMTSSLSTSSPADDKIDENEHRRIQAENSALKTKIENLQAKHEEEMRLATSSNKNLSEQQLNDPLLHSGERGSVSDEKLIHLEAQCERYKQEVKNLQDIQVECETAKEQQKLLQQELASLRERETNEQKVLTSEIETLRCKLEEQSKKYQQQHNELNTVCNKLKTSEEQVVLLRENEDEKYKKEKEKLHGEISSLGQALQNSQNLVDRYQIDNQQRQKQKEDLEKSFAELSKEKNELLQRLGDNDQQAMRAEEMRRECEQQRRLAEASEEGRREAVVKFEESARASGELLARMDRAETRNVELKREVDELKQLAEKRKQVMDRQAIESQENNQKFSEKLSDMEREHARVLRSAGEERDKKVKVLEHRCKQQEAELTRVIQQDRGKTRELDGLQQQMRDLKEQYERVENSRGWFERSLKENETLMGEKQEEHEKEKNEMKEQHQLELQKVQLKIAQKEEEICRIDEKLNKHDEFVAGKDDEISSLKQQIKDGVDRQKLVEKKGKSHLKDLKRQLQNEKKRNEKLQETLRQLSTNNSNIDELLQASTLADDQHTSATSSSWRPNNDDASSSVSSFSFRDLNHHQTAPDSPTPPGGCNLSGETRDLLNRVTALQKDKWQLEERVKHLEISASAMADELLEKSNLLQSYVQHTRSDASHRTRSANEELVSRKLGDRLKSMITGQHQADVTNMKELNNKLTRMLEEEMTKCNSLKEDLISVTTKLAEAESALNKK